MSSLAKVFVFKIGATLLFWCVPLVLFPASILEVFGIPSQTTNMFLRLLGWAYVALCVGYGFGLRSALRGERAAGPIWVGIVSNGGACLYLAYFGASGAWNAWGGWVKLVLWSSVLATAAITAGLYLFGVRDGARDRRVAAGRRP